MSRSADATCEPSGRSPMGPVRGGEGAEADWVLDGKDDLPESIRTAGRCGGPPDASAHAAMGLVHSRRPPVCLGHLGGRLLSGVPGVEPDPVVTWGDWKGVRECAGSHPDLPQCGLAPVMAHHTTGLGTRGHEPDGRHREFVRVRFRGPAFSPEPALPVLFFLVQCHSPGGAR